MTSTNAPLISVIIPTFNNQKTIRETIETVLDQTYSNYELIIINDGSTDSTFKIINSIKDPRTKVFSYPNSGVSASRNRGIHHASGDFIAFLDADDLWTKDKLEAQLKALKNNPQAGVAYSWVDSIDENNNYLRMSSCCTAKGDVYEILLRGNFIVSGSNPMIRSQAIKEIGGFDSSLTHAEDWDLYLKLAARYHFVVIPAPQILYRISTNSASTNVYKTELGALRVIKQAFSQAPTNIQPIKMESVGNLYKHLIYKVLEESTGRQKGFKAAKLFWRYLKNDPASHRLIRLKLSLLSKIIPTIFLPSYQPNLEW